MAKSNSTILVNQFLKGYSNSGKYHSPIQYMAATRKNDKHLLVAQEADTLLFIFPLYTDAMPGQVKYFFESLSGIDMKGKTVGFIVQSGFPEAYHSVFLERYLEKLTRRLDCQYLGTVIKGGAEGIQMMPPYMTRRLYIRFFKLGRYFALSGAFNQKIVKKLRTPYRMNALRRSIFKIMMATGTANFYWNVKLKANHVYEKRFACPYLTSRSFVSLGPD